MRHILFSILFVFLCSFVTGCGGNDYMVHTAATEQDQAQIRWYEYSQTLFLMAHYTKKPAIILFSSESCGVCKKLEDETLSNRKITYLINKDFLPIKITDKEEQFMDIAARFEVSSAPTIIILSSTNIPEELARISGFVDPTSLELALASSSTINTLMGIENDLDNLFESSQKLLDQLQKQDSDKPEDSEEPEEYPH